MDETELKIEHEAPKLKLAEETPEPVAPTEELAPAPSPEPIIPAPTLTEQSSQEPIPQEPVLQEQIPAAPIQIEEVPAEKPKSKKPLILMCIISGAIVLAGIATIFFVFSNKPAPTTTETTTTETTTTTTTTTTTPTEDIDKEDAIVIEDIKAMKDALTAFQTNNDGKVPSNWDVFFENYAPELGKKYKYKTCDFMNFDCKDISGLTWEEDSYTVHIASNASCKSEYLLKQEDSVRRITFYTVLHKKRDTKPAYFCASNEKWYY